MKMIEPVTSAHAPSSANLPTPGNLGEPYRESLLLEASLAASCLGSGLTAIRRYSFADKGRFFAGMFGVTIGLERILKIVVVLEHLLRTHSPPTDKQLRALGHSLAELLKEVRRINCERSLNVDEVDLDDSLSEVIVSMMTAFAKQTRYYNLDVLVGKASSSSDEPLAAWARDVGEEIIKRHYRISQRKRAELVAAEALNNIPGLIVDHAEDDGTRIKDWGTLAAQSALVETKQKYSVFYIHRIAMFCIDVLEQIDRSFSPPLYINEAFRWLWMKERRDVLRRKRWDQTTG
jgi:hypothetical protein